MQCKKDSENFRALQCEKDSENFGALHSSWYLDYHKFFDKAKPKELSYYKLLPSW